MKQVSAALVILAVLNPLCCCWSLAQAEAGKAPMQEDHSCCASDSDSQESPMDEHNAANCEHEDTKSSAVTTSSNVSVPDIALSSLSEVNQEPYDFKYLRRSMESFETTSKAELSVPRWVGIQTDCVRRL